MDSAHQEVDKRLEQTERKINQIYRRAQKEIDKKTSDFFEASARRDEKMKAKVEGGAMSQEDYEAWRHGQLMTGQRYQQMQKQVAAELTNASETAAAYVNGQMPEIYALGHNALEEGVEGLGGYSFTLVDAHTVRHLATEDKTLLPYKYVNGQREERWVTQRVNSEVLQGVLQGDSVQKIAKRLRNVTEMDKASSMRNARTSITSAENKGRMDSYKEAAEMGLIVNKMWLSADDGKTRKAHLELNGQEQEYDKHFNSIWGKIMYPGDPEAERPENVYNCRCTLVPVVKGFKGLTSGKIRYIGGEETAKRSSIVSGSDITESWTPRFGEYNFEIEDVIAAQGFDGLPRVVSSAEFDSAVQESGFIAQRGYRASDQETLDAYRQQLYYGDWYVDCSSGGARYGKGMYVAYNDGTEVTEVMDKAMALYGNKGYVETFTLDKSAKFISYDEAQKATQKYRESWELGEEEYSKFVKKKIDELGETLGWDKQMRAYVCDRFFDVEPDDRSGILAWYKENKESINEREMRHALIPIHDIVNKTSDSCSSIDVGSWAAMSGYDAIKVDVPPFAVILNRTKLIIKEP